ncbi:uncharacterized protein METZ01_LOCUS187090, partial [marine metagenome]
MTYPPTGTKLIVGKGDNGSINCALFSLHYMS